MKRKQIITQYFHYITQYLRYATVFYFPRNTNSSKIDLYSGTEKNLEFSDLRKTYITLLNNFTNGGAEVITGHIGQEVIMNHYHDQKVFNDTLKSFRMIS